MTLFLEEVYPPLQLNPKDTVMNCVGWWNLVFPVCAAVICYISFTFRCCGSGC